MQRVSNTYRQSMKSLLRERAYIMISFGLFNQMAQANATVTEGEYAYYSNFDIFEDYKESAVYATLEENFTKTDGSMIFLPRKEKAGFYDTKLITKDLVTEKTCEVKINLNMHATSIKGFTILFGENYPIDFDVIGNTGQTIEVRGNDKREWRTEEVIAGVTSIKLVFTKMKNLHSRLRIYAIKFGYGLIFGNDSVIDSSLTNYVSPIAADLPQIDFSVRLDNYDQYFNTDNPNSAINYLETGQEMNVMYGYNLPNSTKIEWIQGTRLLCSGWESDESTATIRCQDSLRNLDTEFYKGIYYENGKDLYSLAIDVLEDAGITKYYIDPMLKNLKTKNPIPKVKHKEALQIIANVSRCTLSQSRTGYIQIKSNFMPKVSVNTNGETSYSKSPNILKESEKAEYASLAENYTKADGNTFFLSKSGEAVLETGYVSKEISGDDGKFKNNPVITFSMDNTKNYYGIRLVFGKSLPKQFIVRSYVETKLVNEYEVNSDEISKSTTVVRDFDDCDEMQIEFIQTEIPHNRITLNHFSLNNVADFKMEKQDIMSPLKSIKQELTKEVIVQCYDYQPGNADENVFSGNISAVSGKTETFYIQNPSYNYRVMLNNNTGLADVIGWGNYYVTIRYKVTGDYKLDIRGYRYKITERQVIRSLNPEGKSVKWKNPLVSDMDTAEKLAKWLGDYYKANLEYEYDTRGNPEIDATDIICQENEFVEDMKVNVYRHTLQFSQAFRGKVVARREGGN